MRFRGILRARHGQVRSCREVLSRISVFNAARGKEKAGEARGLGSESIGIVPNVGERNGRMIESFCWRCVSVCPKTVKMISKHVSPTRREFHDLENRFISPGRSLG